MKKLLFTALISLVVLTGCTFEIVVPTGEVEFRNDFDIAVVGGSLQYDMRNISCQKLDIADDETLAYGEVSDTFTLNESDSGTYVFTAEVSPDGSSWTTYIFEDVEVTVEADKTTTISLHED